MYIFINIDGPGKSKTAYSDLHDSWPNCLIAHSQASQAFHFQVSFFKNLIFQFNYNFSLFADFANVFAYLVVFWFDFEHASKISMHPKGTLD